MTRTKKAAEKENVSHFQLAMAMITFGGSSLGKQGATVEILAIAFNLKNLKPDQSQ